MKKYFLIIFLFFYYGAGAQSKVNFSYDAAGNQITRILCINCLLGSAKMVKEIQAVTENDLLKFSPQDVISYYPNPVKEQLYLQWQLADENFVTSVKVYSVTGQLLRDFQSNDSTTSLNISFQSYSSGIYIVLFSYKDGGEKSIKIIKQ